MHMEGGGVNPAQGHSVNAELPVQFEPPPPYSPPDPGGAVVTQQPLFHRTVIVQSCLKNNPVYQTCPACYSRVLTKVKHINSRKTHLMAGFICGCTCLCFLCCLGFLPYALKTFKKTEHYCPNCETHIGSYSKI